MLPATNIAVTLGWLAASCKVANAEEMLVRSLKKCVKDLPMTGILDCWYDMTNRKVRLNAGDWCSGSEIDAWKAALIAQEAVDGPDDIELLDEAGGPGSGDWVKIASTGGVDIRESPINGRGLFATRAAAPGDVLVAKYMEKQNTDDPRTRWEQSDQCRYTNHADKPNAFVRKVGEKTELVADEAIQPNEEITVNYRDATSTMGKSFFYTYRGKPYGSEPGAAQFLKKTASSKPQTFYGIPTIQKQAQTTDDVLSRILNARKNTATDVSEGNLVAGNYRKGRFNYHGLRISIENPKGSTRSGTGADGKKWSTKMKYDYGYIRGTMGADGDPVDVFIGSDPKSEMVFIVNQNTKGGKFDEHKVVLGALDAKQAKQTYLANYEAGWTGCGSVVGLTMQQFKQWLKDGVTDKPAGEVKQAADLVASELSPAPELPWRERVEVFARKPTGEIYGGQWDADKSFALPGGGIDPGEDAATAAVREFMEETGIPITNARKLDVPTVDNPWTDAYRQQAGRNFAGTRTHFIQADVNGAPSAAKLDVWNAGARGYYSPESALKMMLANTNYLTPDAAQRRIEILQNMQQTATIKQAAIKLPPLGKLLQPAASAAGRAVQTGGKSLGSIMSASGQAAARAAAVSAHAAKKAVPAVGRVIKQQIMPKVAPNPKLVAATRPAVVPAVAPKPLSPSRPVPQPLRLQIQPDARAAIAAAPAKVRSLRDRIANVPAGEAFGQRPVANTWRLLTLDGVPGMRAINRAMLGTVAYNTGRSMYDTNNTVNSAIGEVARAAGRYTNATPEQQTQMQQRFNAAKWYALQDQTAGAAGRFIKDWVGIKSENPVEQSQDQLIRALALNSVRGSAHGEASPEGLYQAVLSKRNPAAAVVSGLPDAAKMLFEKPQPQETAAAAARHFQQLLTHPQAPPTGLDVILRNAVGDSWDSMSPALQQKLKAEAITILAGNGGIAKQGGVLDAIKYHAPRIRKLDTVVGGLGGAAAGLAAGGIHDYMSDDEENDTSRYLKYMGGGALAGAGVGNIVGDRARRYVTNAIQTSDYGSGAQVNDLKPGTFDRFMDLAVRDKMNLNKSTPADITDATAREAWRRGMQLPVKDPAFVETAPHTYGYNPEKLTELEKVRMPFVLGRSHQVEGKPGSGTITRKDRFDFDWHPQEYTGFKESLKDWLAGKEKVTSDSVDNWYPLAGGKRKPANVLKSLLLRALAQGALGPEGGINFELHEQYGKPVSQQTFQEANK